MRQGTGRALARLPVMRMKVSTLESMLALGAVIALGAAAVLGYRRANGLPLLARPEAHPPPQPARKPRRKARQP